MKRARQDDGPCESTPESTAAGLLIRSLDLIEPRSNRCMRTPVAEQRNESNLLHRTIEDVASRIKERYRGPGQRITYRVSMPTLHGEPTVEDAKCPMGLSTILPVEAISTEEITFASMLLLLHRNCQSCCGFTSRAGRCA